MRRGISTVCIWVITCLTSCTLIDSFKYHAQFSSTMNPEKDSIYREKAQPSYIPVDFNESSGLYYLCKVWGFAKYFHERNEVSRKKPVNADSLLLNAIPMVLKAHSKQAFRSVLSKMIAEFGNGDDKRSNPFPDLKDYSLINNNWFKDTVCLDKQIRAQLEQLFHTHTGRQSDFAYNRNNEGTVRLSNENTYTSFADEKLRLLGLFRYWNVINFFYPSKNYTDENWDEVLYTSIPKFRAAKSQVEYRKEIYRLTNKLKDSHTSYPASIDGFLFGAYRPNFQLNRIGDSLVISKIRDPQKNKEGFKCGDILLSVDGQDAIDLYDSLASFTGGGNRWSEQRFICNAVISIKDSVNKFTVLRNGERRVIHSRNRKAWDWHQDKRKRIKENEDTPLARYVRPSIAYFDLTSANKDNFAENFERVKDAESIILDLRCYPNTSVLFALAENFVPPNSVFAYVAYADTRYPGMLRMHPSSKPIGSEGYFKGQIIVLVNEETGSFSEYATMLLQANKKTKVVGTLSSGADGNVSTLEFPGQIKTIYSGIGIYYPGMIATQRKGVRIDFPIEPTIESIRSSRDIALEKAIQIIGSPGKNL